jgi:hypothetical protein
MKTLAVKFTRTPKYTPASLSERQLSRIEWLVKATFARECQPDLVTGEISPDWYSEIASGKAMLARRLNKWFSPFWGWEHEAGMREGDCIDARKERHNRRMAWLSGDKDAQKYFVSCWNYLFACALNNGDVKEPRRMSNREYFELRNGYGHF